MSKEELDARFAAHVKWLDSGKNEGALFVSSRGGEDLRGGTLVGAHQRVADSRSTNPKGPHAEFSLSGADLDDADLSGAHMGAVNLSEAVLHRAKLGGAYLWRANLSGAVLWAADLSGANMREATLDGADVGLARLVRVRGLYGHGRARGLGTVKNAEEAVYGDERDFAPWALLRFIGTLHLFSASYVVFIAVTVYATAVRWLNGHVDRWHQWASDHSAGDVSEFAALVARIPTLPVQRHFGLLLLAIGLLALATTLHAIFCPELIKEATETRWTRELNQPLIEYRSAMYSRFWIRYITLVSFGLGGLYTLGYLLWRAGRALWFLLYP